MNTSPTQQSFFRAKDVMRLLSVGRTTAYKIISSLNEELESKGFCTFHGRVSAKYFKERYSIYQQ